MACFFIFFITIFIPFYNLSLSDAEMNILTELFQLNHSFFNITFSFLSFTLQMHFPLRKSRGKNQPFSHHNPPFLWFPSRFLVPLTNPPLTAITHQYAERQPNARPILTPQMKAAVMAVEYSTSYLWLSFSNLFFFLCQVGTWKVGTSAELG